MTTFDARRLQELHDANERMSAALETIAAGGAPHHPITYPTPLSCAAATVENFMGIARKALDR